MTPRHKRFVAEYLIDFNGAGAAVRAGYAARSAKQTASLILARPDVKLAVDAGRGKVEAACAMTREEVLRELGTIARSNIQRYKGADKTKALELLGRHHGLFEDNAGSQTVFNIQINL